MKTTYLNKKGTPVIRKCNNCTMYKQINGMNNMGYCSMMPLHFAFTHEKSVYAIVKDFYVCEHHVLINEHILKQQSGEVELLPYLIERLKKRR